MNRDPITGTFSGNRGLQIEEPLIFEQGMPGRTRPTMALKLAPSQ